MKRIVLFRHAKASWDNIEFEDHERPLNKRGSKDAVQMSKWLVKTDFVPDLIFCSDAVRTRATLALAMPKFGKACRETGADEPHVVIDSQLYLASAERVLKTIRNNANDAQSVMAIGHNPGLHALALTLAGKGETAKLRALSQKFPTASMALYELGDLGFEDRLEARCTLKEFMTPADVG